MSDAAQVLEAERNELSAQIVVMRGAIADARTRVVQFMPDGPERGSVIAFLDRAMYARGEGPPWCECKGPWCEGKDRDAKVQCLGYQIDSDGLPRGA